jgi:hypothetical protein
MWRPPKVLSDPTYFVQSTSGSILRSVETGSVTTLVTTSNRHDDNYELLSKGLGGFNQGYSHFDGGTNKAWLNLLIQPRSSLTTEQISGMRYAMRIMHDTNKLNLPHRRYVFEGGLGFDSNGDGIISGIETTTPWCFAFGEQEWVSGGIFNQIKAAADNFDAAGRPQTPVGQIPCP